MKKLFTTIVVMAMSTLCMAQNSAIYKAQSAIEKKEYAQALEILQTALENPKTTKIAEMQRKIGECCAMIFQPELDNAAKGLPFDTTKFCTYLDKSVEAFTKSHQADIAPDAKGKVKPQFIQMNKLNISQMINYYNYAGMFKYNCGDVKASRDYFIKYIEMPKNPVFSQGMTDTLYTQFHAQYLQAEQNVATMSYQLKDYATTIKYADLALKDTLNLHDLYQLKMVSQYQMGDTLAYMQTLKEAVERTGDEQYTQELITDYMQRKDRDGALALADEIIAKNPSNINAFFLKGSIFLNMPPYDYEMARQNFQKALDLAPTHARANAGMGNAYFNEVVDKMNKGEIKIPYGQGQDIVKKKMAVLQKEVYPYYNKALPFYEASKAAAPDEPRLWCQGLYAVYKQLYMDAKAKELKEQFPDYCVD